MTVFRNRKFLEGIAVGGIGGMIIGSILAFHLATAEDNLPDA